MENKHETCVTGTIFGKDSFRTSIMIKSLEFLRYLTGYCQNDSIKYQPAA